MTKDKKLGISARRKYAENEIKELNTIHESLAIVAVILSFFAGVFILFSIFIGLL